MNASKIIKFCLYGMTMLSLSGCLRDPKDLPCAEMMGIHTSPRVEIVEPADARRLCRYTQSSQGYAIYDFDGLPCPIKVEKEAENTLTTLIRSMQRSRNKQFSAEEIADIMNIISAGAHNPEEEQPDSIITLEDVANYDIQRIRAYLR